MSKPATLKNNEGVVKKLFFRKFQGNDLVLRKFIDNSQKSFHAK